MSENELPIPGSEATTSQPVQATKPNLREMVTNFFRWKKLPNLAEPEPLRSAADAKADGHLDPSYGAVKPIDLTPPVHAMQPEGPQNPGAVVGWTPLENVHPARTEADSSKENRATIAPIGGETGNNNDNMTITWKK